MISYPKAYLSVIVGMPRLDFGVLTHLQKYSPFGLMLTWPFCFHFWLFWKKQQFDGGGNWLPGTEQGIYFRTPGWRWDADLGMIWTWGYFGLHWD